MREINLLEGKVVAPEGMKVAIVASRFNEIIVNKLLGGAIDGLVRHGVDENNITAAWVPGVDRMIMLLRNEENIREVIAFPMSGTAQDLMCGAPNEVTEQQLREVHIKVRD